MKNKSHTNPETLSPATLIYNNTIYDMLVFCDGSWDKTYRKTLCFLDRNAGAKILYIEKPNDYKPQENAVNFMMINDFLHVLRPNVISFDEVFKLLPYHVRTGRIAIGWFAAGDYAHFSELIRFDSVINDYSTINVDAQAVQKKREQKYISTSASFMPRPEKRHFPIAG